jgi:hypothetical protein
MVALIRHHGLFARPSSAFPLLPPGANYGIIAKWAAIAIHRQRPICSRLDTSHMLHRRWKSNQKHCRGVRAAVIAEREARGRKLPGPDEPSPANPGIILAHALASITDSRGAIRLSEWRPPLPASVRQALAGVEVNGGPDGPQVDRDWGEPGDCARQQARPHRLGGRSRDPSRTLRPHRSRPPWRSR